MKLLAIETATDNCSVALLIDGECLQRSEIAPRQHANRLLPMVESLCAEASCTVSAMDAMAFGRGPGSFTGLRIAAGVIQGLALGADVPVVPVSTLAALALPYARTSQSGVLAALDARMQQVYWGAYCLNAAGELELQGEEQVLSPKDVALPDGAQWCAVGNGWKAYEAELSGIAQQNITQFERDALPHAKDVCELAKIDFEKGLAVAPEYAIPVYIRNNVVG